jgi:hypothetical protein
MGSLEQHLLSVNVVLISVGAWFILWVLHKIWKGMDKNRWVSRFKPLYPAVLCQGLIWIPGALPPDQEPEIGGRILMALWCGFLASIGYQLIKRFLGQRGIDLPDKPDDLFPQSDKEDDKQNNDSDSDDSDNDADNDADDDESEDSESRTTPIETPIPRGAKK